MFSNIFTNYLYSKKLDVDLISLKKHILEVKRDDEKGVSKSNYGGWQSKGFNKTNKFNQYLFQRLASIIEEIKSTVDCKHDLELNQYWYNINKNGSYNAPHNHVGLKNDNIISGVFYIQTFDNSGRLVFKRNEPLVGVMFANNTHFNEYNASIWNVNPNDNLCCLFPSHLEHFVETNLNSSERISMSFNYSIKRSPSNNLVLDKNTKLPNACNPNINTPPDKEVSVLLDSYQSGKLEVAEKLALTMSKKFPEYPFSWKILGAILEKQGRNIEALNANNKALSLVPNDVEALNNLGIILKNLKRLVEAESVFKKTLKLNSDNTAAHYNLGNTLKELGKLNEAEKSFRAAIDINPNFAFAYNNLGNTLKELGNNSEAITNLSKAITLNPNFTEAYDNLGIILLELGKIKETIAIFNKAISLNPKYTKAYNSLGAAYLALGNIKDAVASFNKAIAVNPNYLEAWNNLYFAMETLKEQKNNTENYISEIFKDKLPMSENIHFSILKHKLYTGSEQSEYYYKQAIEAIAKKKYQVQNPKALDNNLKNTKSCSKKIVVLLNFGRSGTGLLHSLIDNHPEVSTLPSIYFSEFFDSFNWEKITKGGWANIIDNFTESYPVLFDARSSIPVPSISMTFNNNLGVQEGMTALGENKNEFLYVDKTLFKKELNSLISEYAYLDQITFFKLVHSAYEKANNKSQKNTIFYHIHNPDINAKLSFINDTPHAKWLIMVRDPIQSCESWINEAFHKDNTYSRISTRIVSMLYKIDSIEFKYNDAIGLRLEDLKKHPRKTMPALCKWMGIKEEETLYEMTANGKKWWGDQSSPNMPAFGEVNNSKAGHIFSDNDRFILKTLFYPFRASFGYVEENLTQFKVDIQKIKPMLNEIFDFEKKFITRMKISTADFKKSGMYLYLRARMLDRWELLNKINTYPNMLKPLKVNS